MVERDIQEFLKTGSWTTSRAKSPARSFNLGLHKSRFPPPPSVEDEVESLAREHGSTIVSGTSDEDPKFPGDVEQFPILQEVHEYNPERRFVLVSNSNPSSDAGVTDDDVGKRTGTGEYEANTCRKYVVVPSDDESAKEPGKRRGLEKRKSRQELPRIDTGLQQDRQPAASGRNRSKSTTYTDNPAHDYFDRQRESQPAGDGLLSPVITSKYSTKGRERAYYDTNGGSSARNRAPSSDRRGPPPDDKRRGDRGPHSMDPPVHKRSPSYTESPRSERRSTANTRYREEVSSSRTARNGSPPRTKRRDSSPSSRVRMSNSPPYPQSARDKQKLPGRSPSFKGRRRSPEEEDEDSEADFPRVQRPNRRRESIIHQDDRNTLLSPDQGRPPRPAGPRSRGSTPLASPRVVQNQFPEPELGTSPRSAATFPYVKESRRVDERAVPSLSSAESAPPKSRSRMDDDADTPRAGGRARASSLLKAAAVAAPIAAMALPILIPGETSSPAERRKSPLPPPHARQSSLEGSPPKGYWQPPAFNPTEQRATLEKPVMSYRRYSEDVQQGVVKALPECPRTVAITGHYDWLTLPQARNFDICPDCYESNFANTQFKHSFVPAPLRGADMPVTCDFGSSHWYRVAWLMTVKYGIPDLRLLKAIAAVGVKHQQCAGSREASRIWYSILDPYTRRPIPTFTVCPNCAKTIEVILPNLYGVFVELDAPAIPTRGVCDMHFTPGRKRFLKIFDLLESTSDAALSRRTPPDLQRLADQVRDVTITQECMRDEPVPGRKWHVMESIPEFTVCEECFEDVVLPIVEGEGGSVARNFFKRRQERPMATCQLYSDRMRDIFRKACRRDDLGYLDDRVKERLDVEASIKAKLAEHPDEDETRELLKEWQKWE
ncbi:hypothetical protein CONLIGDRAFT_654348 [Coniochaeta ligniaria NRRL 30616]|uniref:Ser/arg-related nuclear matrix protein n=1 Tax=Coniochaeta ligniaria NRRL 30616 TaxID=1408157 RepID=A0A1J7JJH9_9PEZI|nr:hypothetical protein CONLIGDRAFT_654348 [Coniochaeta ligniaria NRRL 30616]